MQIKRFIELVYIFTKKLYCIKFDIIILKQKLTLCFTTFLNKLKNKSNVF